MICVCSLETKLRNMGMGSEVSSWKCQVCSLHFIIVMYSDDFTGEVYVVHFWDMCLWSNATILYDKVSKITLLANTITINNLLDTKDIWDFFDTRIKATLGYCTSAVFPSIFMLAELTKESWLGELVLDACAQIL